MDKELKQMLFSEQTDSKVIKYFKISSRAIVHATPLISLFTLCLFCKSRHIFDSDFSSTFNEINVMGKTGKSSMCKKAKQCKKRKSCDRKIKKAKRAKKT